jgi:DNA-binding transcriptional ArsR family regulator
MVKSNPANRATAGSERPIADGGGTRMSGNSRLSRFTLDRIPESSVYTVLSNERRRETLHTLLRTQDEVTVRELSEIIAAKEAGERPAPRNVRESVYVSLHQTHLPTLDDHGLIEYDTNRKIVRSMDRARDVEPYLDVRTAFGLSWVGIYQWLGIVGLCTMVATVANAPILDLLPPLLVGSWFLGLFALASSIRLWRVRGEVLRILLGGS